MSQSNRKKRNDANAMPPLDFAAAGVSDGLEHFNMNGNNGYANFGINAAAYNTYPGPAPNAYNMSMGTGFGNAFSNPFSHASRNNASHHSSQMGMNSNPFGMSTMSQANKRTHSSSQMADNLNGHTAHSQHAHTDVNAFNSHQLNNAFSSDPSISFMSQPHTANASNPYAQSGTGTASHGGFDALTSMSQSSLTSSSRHKSNTSYDPFGNAQSHSASDLFTSSSRRHNHHTNPSTADLSVLSYGTATSNTTTTNTAAQPNGSRYNTSTAATTNPSKDLFGRGTYYNNGHATATHSTHHSAHHSKPYASASARTNYASSSSSLLPTSKTSSSASKPTKSTSSTSKRKSSSLGARSKSYGHATYHKKYKSKGSLNRKYDPMLGVLQTGRRSGNANGSGGGVKDSSNSEVTGVARLSLHHNPPVEGCKIEPYVILSCSNGSFVLSDQSDCRFTWYRSEQRLCAKERCSKPATLQCLTCSKLQIVDKGSYFCSSQCMSACWPVHREVHQRALDAAATAAATAAKVSSRKGARASKSKSKMARASGPSGPSISSFEEKYALWDAHDDNHQVTNEWRVKSAKQSERYREDPDSLYGKFPPPIVNKWTKIPSRATEGGEYRPSKDDIGRQLLLECAPLVSSSEDDCEKTKTKSKTSSDTKSKNSKGEKVKEKEKKERPKRAIANECQDTSPCLGRPEMSIARKMCYYHSEHPSEEVTFKVLSYNCLAPIYCTRAMYPYVAPYALEWDYRKFNILREILRYRPEVICLQEVEKPDFEEYFTPQLSREGYEGMFRKKNRTGENVDGCAIFFKRDRFDVSSRYHIDFNDTSSLYLGILQDKASGSTKPISDQRAKEMLKRLTKGNIALIVVLEEKEKSDKNSKETSKDGEKDLKSSESEGNNNNNKDSNISKSCGVALKEKKKKESVALDKSANSGVSTASKREKRQICIANTHVFWDPAFKDVKIWQAWILCEEISRALGRDLPLILCGDFNSEPSSAVYEYLTKGRVDTNTYTQLQAEFEQKKRCVLPPRDNLRHRLGLKSHYSHGANGKEPQYTNYTDSFKDTLDYVLFSSKSIEAVGYLQEPPEKEMSREVAFPNSRNSSDHIPLMGCFAFRRDYDAWMRERRSADAVAQRSEAKHSASRRHHAHGGHHSYSSASGGGGGGVRPSAAPRHRQHGSHQTHHHASHVNVGHGVGAMIPPPTTLTKTQSSTLQGTSGGGTTALQPTSPPQHRRHHSLEMLGGEAAAAASSNPASPYTGNSMSTTSLLMARLKERHLRHNRKQMRASRSLPVSPTDRKSKRRTQHSEDADIDDAAAASDGGGETSTEKPKHSSEDNAAKPKGEQSYNDRDSVGDNNLHIAQVLAPMTIIEDGLHDTDYDTDTQCAEALRRSYAADGKEDTPTDKGDDNDAAMVEVKKVEKKKKRVTRIVTDKSLKAHQALQPPSPVEVMNQSVYMPAPNQYASGMSSTMYPAQYSQQYYPTMPYAMQSGYPAHVQQQQQQQQQMMMMMYQQQAANAAAYKMRYQQQQQLQQQQAMSSQQQQQSMLPMMSPSPTSSSTPKSRSKASRSKLKKRSRRSAIDKHDDDYKELASPMTTSPEDVDG